MSRDEQLRRLRLGDVQKVIRDRYKYELPNDDAGREDLCELLLPISLGQGGERKMRLAIGLWAPWMTASEADAMIARIERLPDRDRKPNARTLGKRMNLLQQDRVRIGVRTIAPVDMTPEQLKERRKRRDAEYRWRKRRAAKMKPRAAWLANRDSVLKPWLKAGMSRRSWYRKRAKERTKVAQLVGTGVSSIKLTYSDDRLVPKGKPRKAG